MFGISRRSVMRAQQCHSLEPRSFLRKSVHDSQHVMVPSIVGPKRTGLWSVQWLQQLGGGPCRPGCVRPLLAPAAPAPQSFPVVHETFCFRGLCGADD